MSNYLILALPFVLVAYRMLLTNFIVPHIKKKALYKKLKTSSDWPRIKRTEHTLENLFKGVHAKTTSRVHRFLHFTRSKEFIYGEIDYLSFYTILEQAGLSDRDVFYDLGAGSGKAVFTASLFFNVSKSYGIELLPPLYNQANARIEKAKQLFENTNNKTEKKYLQQISSIQFINHNFLSYDFSDADIIYVAATCLGDSTWENLIHKMAGLKPGSRVIVTTKNIQHEKFEIIYQGIDLMSWGLCPVTIYKITS
jgi:hypothetical protein